MNEALATGLPAIVSDRVGCGPDLVRADETGAIFPMGDAGALAAAIERIRAGIEASVDYAAACRARAVDHGLDRATAGLVAACQVVTRLAGQVISGKGSVISSEAVYGIVPRRHVNAARSSSGRVALPVSIVATAAASGLAWLLTSDWIAAAALWVLWAGWHWLRDPEGPPVLPLAFAFQWVQVTAGLYYYALSGRRLPAMDHSDYQPMVLIGLGCLIALLVGIRIGMLTGRWWPPIPQQESVKPFGWAALISLYVVLLAVTGPVQALAWELPEFTQAILALELFPPRLAVHDVLGLAQRRLGWCRIVLLLAGEIVFGFTGYYAGSREPS